MILQKTITPSITEQTEQVFQRFMLERWQNRYQSRLPNIEKQQKIFSKIARLLALFGLIVTGGFWLVYLGMIVLDKIMLSGNQAFDYPFLAFLTIATIGFWFLFRYENKIREKINKKNRAYLQNNMIKNSHFYAKRTFKNAKQYTEPFMAIYQFDGTKISYFRQIDGQKMHQWTRSVENNFYHIGNGFVVFFKKPTASYIRAFLFFDNQDEQKLIEYLKRYSNILPL